MDQADLDVDAEDIEDEVEAVNVQPPQFGLPAQAEVVETQLWRLPVTVTNTESFPQGIEYELVPPVPEGCRLDDAGENLEWQPTELQGPGKYELRMVGRSKADPDLKTEHSLTVSVKELNAPPQFGPATAAKAEPGKLLEAAFDVNDVDFPSQKVQVAIVGQAPPGLRIDAIRKVILWDVPPDFDRPEVQVSLSATDNGTPPGRSTFRLPIQVINIKPTVTAADYRRPHAYVTLPDLPRPGDEATDTMTIPFSIEEELPAIAGNNCRLSVITPEPLKSRINIKYPKDRSHACFITVTDPFEPIDVDRTWPDGAIAMCEFTGKSLEWTWTYTKTLPVRDLQNSLRDCVVAAEFPEEGVQALIALQAPLQLPPVSIGGILDADDVEALLARYSKIAVPVGLLSDDCRLVALRGADHELATAMDDTWLVMSSDALRKQLRLNELELKLVPSADRMRMQLKTNPSISETRSQVIASRNKLRTLGTSFRKWNSKLIRFRNDYNQARRISATSASQRILKETQMSRAAQGVRAAEARLAELSQEIPLTEALIVNRERELASVLEQVEPLRQYQIHGEFYRLLGDVRVIVLALNDIKVEEEGEPPAE